MSDQIIKDLAKRMEGAVASFHKDLKGLRTGRASTALLEGVTVEVYGSRMPLDQVATVSVPESRLLSVQVWDQSNAPAIEKAIANAGLGLNPSADGALIRVPIPDLSEDRRKELVKIAGSYAEKSKVSIRNVRRDGMDVLKKSEKDGDISQDEQRNLSDEVQKITDKFVKEIDDSLSFKEKEILTV